MASIATDVVAPPVTARALNSLRRWWIKVNLPNHDSDLSQMEWTALNKRYVAAGGTTEEFERLVEIHVLES